MKRIHLFEFEDFSWYPAMLRRCTTRLIIVMHKLLGSPHKIASLLAAKLRIAQTATIVDLCSGSGGPMPEVLRILRNKHGLTDLRLTLTDLYPDQATAHKLNNRPANGIQYLTTPIDAANLAGQPNGFRTMVGSFHHMPPPKAREILATARNTGTPIFIFEISDNSIPISMWWIAFPVNLLMTFFITPMVRPLTWQQLVFTYLIPIIPICFGWDGAVSSARTYTPDDLDELLDGIYSDDYCWEKGIIGDNTRQVYLMGTPDPQSV